MSAAEVQVGIVFGSESDRPVMEETARVLDRLGIGHEMLAVSAHRTPEKVAEYARSARGRGLRVLIAGAGMSAALPGAVAALTTLPVIGVPIDGSSLGGIDSLLSIAQMPPGVPVAAVAIGKPGAKNAAILAAQILALSDDAVAARLDALKADLASGAKV
jgi:phosphoribosylaminoimidazole carboxylase PurE protein